MGLAEILWRLFRAARAVFDPLRARLAKRPYSSDRVVADYLALPPLCHQPPPKPASDTFNIFDFEFPVDIKFDWHLDYHSGISAPQGIASRINIRDREKIGDIKYIWEINRHQHLSALMATQIGHENPGQILETLQDWIDRNPYLRGVNWTSSLELALRAISWTFILEAARATQKVSADTFRPILGSLAQQLGFIARHLSRYSSANNHLIGEAAGLFIGSQLFTGSPRAARARSILEAEIQKQVSPDGINREQATAYHLFTLEFFLLALVLGIKVGKPFSDAYRERIRAMLDYLASVATSGGELPNFGDSDDGRGFLLGFGGTSLSTVMALGGVLFEDPRYLKFAAEPGMAVHVLLGPEGVKSFKTLKQAGSPFQYASKLYREGGKVVMGDPSLELKAVFDFGEHSYGSIAAHAHADALSLQIARGDRYFLIDPGTFSYHSFPEWRDYFRGTAAHNTVRIDGQNQSIIGGQFLWTHKAKSRLVEWRSDAEADICIAEHDGYRRLADPVLHRRTIEFLKAAYVFNITDEIICREKHRVEVFFHLHPECEIKAVGPGSVQVQRGDQQIVITGDHSAMTFDVFKGQEDPIAGWHSPAFHRKIPINTLVFSGSISAESAIHTTIKLI